MTLTQPAPAPQTKQTLVGAALKLLAKRKATATKSAAETWRELLGRADAFRSGDEERLVEAAEALSVTVESFDADAAALTKLTAAKADLAKPGEIEALIEAQRIANVALAAAEQARNDAREAALRANQLQEAACNRDRRAKETITALHKSNPLVDD